MPVKNTVRILLTGSGPIAKLARQAYRSLAQIKFTNSSKYWQQRYLRGGTSGPGSYNRLAKFKADFLNEFVSDKNIQSVVELGCGDGAQLALAKYPAYLGIDVSQAAVDICRGRFVSDETKQFELLGHESGMHDLGLSLDVIYHLVEEEIFEDYMSRLFDMADRYVIIYSSNKIEETLDPHVRHRLFTEWIEAHRPEWTLHLRVKNAFPFDTRDPDNTSFADFYVFSRLS